MPRRRIPLSFVAYIRVSSRRQAYEGFSLEAQTDAIQAYANHRAAVLHSIHEDVLPGGGDPMKRPGLRAAVSEAAARKCSILVNRVDRVDRLARSMQMLEILTSHGIPVYTVKDGKVTRRQLTEKLRLAESRRNQLSRGTSDAHSKKTPAERKKLVPNMPDARRRGTMTNAMRAHERNLRMFAVLDAHPEWLDLSLKDLARILNDAGHLDNRRPTRSREELDCQVLRPLAQPVSKAPPRAVQARRGGVLGRLAG